MAGFPSLQPALTISVDIDPPFVVGSASRGTPLNVVPMKGGTVVSEAGFSPSLDGKFVGSGNDYIRVDPDGKFMRLDAHGVIEEKSRGTLVYLNYHGVIALTPELQLVLSRSPEAKSTDFGNAFIEVRFEMGDEGLKDLELGVFVGAGRFIVKPEKQVVVEYKVSKVVLGKS